MSRVRVLDLAKELSLDTKTTILKLQEIGVQVKNHFNALSDTDADRLRQYVRSGSKPGATASGKSAGRVVVVRRRAAEADTNSENSATTDDASSAAEATAPTQKIIKRSAASAAKAPEATEEIKEVSKVGLPADEKIAKSVVADGKAPADNNAVTAKKEVVQDNLSASVKAGDGKTKDIDQKTAQVDMSKPVAEAPQSSQPLSAPASSGSATIVRQAPTQTSEQAQVKPNAATPGGASFQGAVIVRKAPDKPAPAASSHGGGYQQNSRPSGSGYQQRPPYDRGNQGTGAGVRTYDRSADGGNRSASYHSGSGQQRPQGARTPYGSGSGMGSGYGAGGGGGNRYGSQGGNARPSYLNTPPPAEAPIDKTRPNRDKTRDQQKRKAHEEEESLRRGHKAKTREDSDLGYDDYLEQLDEVSNPIESSEDDSTPLRTVYTPVPNRKKSSSSSRRKDNRKNLEVTQPTKASKKIIRIEDAIAVGDLASEMSVKVTAVVKSLMGLGMMATANQVLDYDTASLVAQEYGFEVQNVALSLTDILAQKSQELDSEQKIGAARPPVVTIMGHVDHGKTSLLDVIRSANVASGEAGGITQHIGAYQVEHNGRKITFLDTPGHAAFTQMRARGAQITDVVILVVAGDDGVMPQTIEAIAHAKAANVPIIVAINKMDKPQSDAERITRELSQHNVTPEDWGGDSIFVKVSAKEKTGIDELLEAILLQAEVLDLKAPTDGQVHGVVIESKLDKSRGPVATVLVTQGSLKVQDWIVAGTTYGRVRAMQDGMGQKITTAEPSTPVEILGLGGVPASGDQFNGVANDSIAKEAVAYRVEKQRLKDLASQSKPASLDDMFARMNEDAQKGNELPLIIKADTHGSVEAIRSSVQKLDTDKIKTRVISAGVGGITESDVTLAHASKALVIGFNVRPDKVAAQTAEHEGVIIQTYSIIYQLIEDVEKAMAGKLAPIRSEKVIGHAEVRNLFSVPKIGVIAGSFVTDGKIMRNAHIRVIRDQIVIYTGRVGSLKRFKEDAKEVNENFECGIGVENYNDLKLGDVLESFIIEETAATLR